MNPSNLTNPFASSQQLNEPQQVIAQTALDAGRSSFVAYFIGAGMITACAQGHWATPSITLYREIYDRVRAGVLPVTDLIGWRAASDRGCHYCALEEKHGQQRR